MKLCHHRQEHITLVIYKVESFLLLSVQGFLKFISIHIFLKLYLLKVNVLATIFSTCQLWCQKLYGFVYFVKENKYSKWSSGQIAKIQH